MRYDSHSSISRVPVHILQYIAHISLQTKITLTILSIFCFLFALCFSHCNSKSLCFFYTYHFQSSDAFLHFHTCFHSICLLFFFSLFVSMLFPFITKITKYLCVKCYSYFILHKVWWRIKEIDFKLVICSSQTLFPHICSYFSLFFYSFVFCLLVVEFARVLFSFILYIYHFDRQCFSFFTRISASASSELFAILFWTFCVNICMI